MGIPRCPWGIPKGCRRQPSPCSWGALHPGLNTCMQTFQASVRVRVDGRSQIVQTQIRAPNSNDARWLLWAQFGFHSITSGPRLSSASSPGVQPGDTLDALRCRHRPRTSQLCSALTRFSHAMGQRPTTLAHSFKNCVALFDQILPTRLSFLD